MPRREIRDWCQEVEMDELSSTGERVYVRLRMAADSAGRFYGDAEWVLSKCFSCRVHLSVDEVEQALCELEAAGMVVRYEVEGGRYLAITEWGVRQRSEPKFPAPPVRVARPGDAVSDGCPSAVSQLSDKRQSVVGHMSDSCQTSPLSPSFPPTPPHSSPTPPHLSARGRARAGEGHLGGDLENSGVNHGEAAPPQVPDSDESGGVSDSRGGVIAEMLSSVNVFRASELPFKEEVAGVVPKRPKRCAGVYAFDVPGSVEEVLAEMRNGLHYSEREDERVRMLATDFYEHYKDGRTAGGGLLKNWRYKAKVWLQENARKWQKERLREEQRGRNRAAGQGVREDIVIDAEGF